MKKLLLILMLVSVVFGFEATDNFDRQTGQSLDTGSWFKVQNVSKITIRDSCATNEEYTAVQAHWRVAFSSNQFSQFKINRLNSTVKAANLYLHGGLATTDNRYELKVYKDSLKMLYNTTVLTKINITINDGDSVRFSSYGDSLYAHVNNSQVIVVFENTHRNGYIGIGFDNYVSGTYNRMDNFTGGVYYPTYFDDVAGTPATINRQPSDTTISDLDTARFSISATGTGLTHQWFLDGVAVTGATDSIFKFFASTIYNRSTVYCQLFTDTLVSSDTVTLIVRQPAPNHTGWPLEKLSWDIDKAYPGVEYNYRLGIKGGDYPYRFTLRHGPAGMTIDTVTGEIKWIPSGATVDSVRVTVKDMLGDSLVVQYVITATTTGFYFVDSANGNNGNTGTEASPWATLTYASTTADSSNYIYVKKGTYNETFTITETDCGRIIAYPGDSVTIKAPSGGNTTIGVVSVKNGIFKGITCDANDRRWVFNVSGSSRNIIWYKNEMRNAFDTIQENPCFIFFGDQATPYTNMVIQENIFHDLENSSLHGASVTTYEVINSLYEDNHAYDIDGRGVNEKVGGKRNTFRNNVFNDIRGYEAIVLNSNPSSDSTEICYNHIYDCPVGGMMIGSNGTYVANIFIHHNTCKGSLFLSYPVNNQLSTNINIYKNIIGKGVGSSYWYIASSGKFPLNFRTRVLIDSNIVFGRVDLTQVASSYTGGMDASSWSQWQDSGKDNNSLYMQLTYDADSIPILSDSLLAIYGHLASGNFTYTAPDPEPPVITSQPRDTTVNDGQSAPFTIDATNATGYQWYGNGDLIPGATNSVYSFTATLALNNSKIYCRVTNATDTVWSDTATLTVNALPKTPANITVEPVSDTVTAGQTATFFVTASGSGLVYQWYRNDSLIAGATNDTFTYTARSQVGNYTDNIYCLLTTDTTISTDTVNLLVNGLVVSGTQQTDSVFTLLKQRGVEVGSDYYRLLFQNQDYRNFIEVNLDNITLEFSFQGDCPDQRGKINWVNLKNGLRYADSIGMKPRITYLFTHTSSVPNWLSTGGFSDAEIRVIMEEFIDSVFNKVIPTSHGDKQIKELISSVSLLNELLNPYNDYGPIVTNHFWTQHIPRWWKVALEKAKSVAPNVELIWNENYVEYRDGKYKSSSRMPSFIDTLIADGSINLIDRICIEAHFYNDTNSVYNYARFKEQYNLLKSKVGNIPISVSEFDFCNPKYSNQKLLDKRKSAKQSANFIKQCIDLGINQFYVWGWDSKESWINRSDVFNEKYENPCWYDSLNTITHEFEPNISYYTILDMLKNYGKLPLTKQKGILLRIDNTGIADSQSNFLHTINLKNIKNIDFWSKASANGSNVQITDSSGNVLPRVIDTIDLQNKQGKIDFNFSTIPDRPQYVYIKYGTGITEHNDTSIYRINDCIAKISFKPNKIKNMAETFDLDSIYNPSGTALTFGADRFGYYAHSNGNAYVCNKNNSTALQLDSGQIFLVVKYDSTNVVNTPSFMAISDGSSNAACMNQSSNFNPWQYNFRNGIYISGATTFWTRTEKTLNDSNWQFSSFSWGNNKALSLNGAVPTPKYDTYTGTWKIAGPTTSFNIFTGRSRSLTQEMQKAYISDIAVFNKPKSVEYRSTYYNMVMDTSFFKEVTLPVLFNQSTDTLKLVCSNNQNVESWQWYKNNAAISGATDSVLPVVVDSTSATKSVYYCEISNGAENKKVGDWTIERKADGRTVSRKNKYKSK